jgi:large subunit ribosomal protein L3
MTLGVVGRKSGMTRIFREDGASIPVTIVEVAPNRVTQVKTADKEGYSAVQLATGQRHRNRINKSAAGVLKKASVESARDFHEFRIEGEEINQFSPGLKIELSSVFTVGQKVDVTGTTIGKGYAGTIKRHNFSSGDATHGNSVSHRTPGSIGQRQTPGRVFKGKRMSGHLGNTRCTTLNLELVRIDAEKELLFIKGAVPGSKGGKVVVRPAIRA